MKLRRLMVVGIVAALGLFPMAASGLDADLYGYTKAAEVSGNLGVSPDRQVLELTGFSCSYYHPLEVYVTAGYDPSGGELVGVIPPGFQGSMTFTPARPVTGEDMVLLKVPGWTVPLGLGLFRD